MADEITDFLDLVADDPVSLDSPTGDGVGDGAGGEASGEGAPASPAAEPPVGEVAGGATSTPPPTPEPPAPPPATPAVVVPTAAAPVIPTAPAAPAAAVPQLVTPAAQPVAAPAAPAAPVDAKAQLEQRARARQATVDAIAARVTLTPEQKENWALEPEKVLPQMIAEAQVQTYEMAFQTIYGMLPRLIQEHLNMAKASQTAEEEFYGQFPALRSADPRFIGQYVTAIRTSNPRISREELIKMTGLTVSAALGVPMPGAAPTSSAPAHVPQAPPIPLRSASAPMGGPTATPAQPNIWAELIKDD